MQWKINRILYFYKCLSESLNNKRLFMKYKNPCNQYKEGAQQSNRIDREKKVAVKETPLSRFLFHLGRSADRPCVMHFDGIIYFVF